MPLAASGGCAGSLEMSLPAAAAMVVMCVQCNVLTYPLTPHSFCRCARCGSRHLHHLGCRRIVACSQCGEAAAPHASCDCLQCSTIATTEVAVLELFPSFSQLLSCALDTSSLTPLVHATLCVVTVPPAHGPARASVAVPMESWCCQTFLPPLHQFSRGNSAAPFHEHPSPLPVANLLHLSQQPVQPLQPADQQHAAACQPE